MAGTMIPVCGVLIQIPKSSHKVREYELKMLKLVIEHNTPDTRI